MLIGIDASRATAAQRTGTEFYAYHLIRELLTLTQDTHTLRLYFNQPPAADLLASFPHVEHVIIPAPRLWTHLQLARELHQRPPDVCFTPAHVIPYTYHGPSVATVHDLGYHYFPETHTRAQVAYLKWSTRHNGRRSQVVLADSAATQRDLTHFYGVPAAKVRVVYPGIAPELLATALKIEKLPDLPAPYLLFLSTLQPRKNVKRIVRAFAQIAADIPHTLVLAGKLGWHADSIVDAIQELDPAVRERIQLPGYIPDEDKASFIAGADALLYPSLYEGFGFPLLEGNACGTAVLASNTSSLPELAGEGAAYLVDPLNTGAIAAAMYQLATDPPLRQRLITAGKANVQRFTWRKAAEQTLAALEEAAQA